MCTAATYKTKDFYFGRTLDYEFSYGEQIVITPRNYTFFWHDKKLAEKKCKYAIAGMAHVEDNYPLYYDAVNEKGLGMAGLNFVGNAVYHDPRPSCDNVTSYEFIPWILGRCASVKEARASLASLCITKIPFSDMLPTSSLHWMIADEEECIVVESVTEGIKVYDNPFGVLTNNPPFEQQCFQLNDYQGLSPRQPENTFAKDIPLQAYSRGMGALGLPGDLSSSSRFVRAAFTRLNSKSGDSEVESVAQFFHILGAVAQQKGCCEVEPGKYEYTIYTSCANASKGLYYYTTYENPMWNAVDMHRENLDGEKLYCYPLRMQGEVHWQN
ncbi:MAG: choloylglycine hydrolase [Eubacterium sp.]